MKQFILKIGIILLKPIYGLMKMMPQKKRVVILSRQANEPTQDLQLLKSELERRNIQTIVLCKKLEDGIKGAIKYLAHFFTQMMYLATSSVAVLDSYCIPASLFKKRKGLTIIQMWHALGSMKKFGKSILDMPEGKSSSVAKLMKMHEGYDYIFTSSEKSRPAFAEAFGYPKEKLSIMSLPRVDAIMDIEKDKIIAKEIFDNYPMLMGKKNILYAPTLRVNKDMSQAVSELVDAFTNSDYNLIIKMHPLTKIKAPENFPKNIIMDSQFSTSEMFSVATYVITDYSAITYEAALKGLPLFFYAFDKDEYFNGRAFYLDYDREMPGPICSSAKEIKKAIELGNHEEQLQKTKFFAKEYIEKQKDCTKEIADLIESKL